MNLCRDCREKLEVADDNRFPFKASVVLGGIGVTASIVTGSIILAPLAIMAGASMDIVRCDQCGRESQADEENYKLLATGEDENGEYFSPFKPESYEQEFNAPKGMQSLLNKENRPSRKRSQPAQSDHLEPYQPFSSPEDSDLGQEESAERYRYDEYQQKLVRIEEPNTSPADDFEDPNLAPDTDSLMDLLEDSIETGTDDGPTSPDIPLFDSDTDGGLVK